MKIVNDVTELVGKHPCRIRHLTRCWRGVVASLSFITAHSVKDRIGVAMIDAAEKAGR